MMPCLFISEHGTKSIEILPMDTGFVWSDELKMAWNVIHALKVRVEGYDQLVLPITEKSRIPLDPFDHFKADEVRQLASIKTVGREKYKEAYARLGDDQRKSLNAQMMKTLLFLAAILVFSVIIALWVKR